MKLKDWAAALLKALMKESFMGNNPFKKEKYKPSQEMTGLDTSQEELMGENNVYPPHPFRDDEHW